MRSIVILVVLFLCSQPLWAQTISPLVEKKLKEQKQIDIIVYLKEKTLLKSHLPMMDRTARIQYLYKELSQTALKSQKNLIAFLKASKFQHQSFYIENAIAVFAADDFLIRTISAFGEIEKIAVNATGGLNLPEVPALENRKVEPHLSMIGVDQVWDKLKFYGQSIVIAGQDTGYYWEHSALKNQYRGFNAGNVDHRYSWHNAIHNQGVPGCVQNQASPCDDTGHGTHTMGTMVGDDGLGNQIGVAPQAKWIGCRNMHNGVGTLASYLECFEFFLAPYPQGGDPKVDGRPDLAPHIVNNSWSCPIDEGCENDALLDTMKVFKAAGIFVVVAAGNYGPQCGSVGTPPANHSTEVMSVGAYNTYTKDIAFFSGLGPTFPSGGLAPHVIAPGVFIRSAVHTGVHAYDDKAGTSMASPQIAGVVALLWSARPELIGNIQATQEILQKTATPMTAGTSCTGFPGSKIPNAVYGYGMINAYKALTTP